MKTYIYSALALLGLALSACQKNGGYEPAPQPAEDGIEAYFLSSNASEYILGLDVTSITLKVGRMQSDFAASVPVIVDYSDDVFSIPSTVEFAAGEDTAELTIEFPGIPSSVEKNFIIRLADEYVNPYAIHDGSDVFSGTVLVSKWIKIAEDAEFWLYEKLDCVTYSDVYWLEGLNRFRFTNFLESGYDLSFSIVGDDKDFDPEDISTWTGEFSPLDHYAEEATTDSYKYWSLRDDEGNYFSWKPEESPATINGLYVYRTSYYSSVEMCGTGTDTYRGCLTTWLSTEEGTLDGYMHIYLYWAPLKALPTGE